MKYTPINGWTKQKMIDHVKANFKGKSKNTFAGTCVYRGQLGTKCAVGIFIPDELYDHEMEGWMPNPSREKATLVSKFPSLEVHMPLNDAGMQQFQNVHDQSIASKTLEDMLNWIEANVEDT